MRWSEERALHDIVEATAATAGRGFFHSLVKHLALALEVRHAFVAEFAGSNRRVRTLAFWCGEDWAENIEYDLEGTPCEEVLRGDLCLHTDGVKSLFPADAILKKLEATSYLGVPLVGTGGQKLGHLAVIDSRPMTESPRGLSIFRVFAERARVELERQRADEALEETCRRLEVEVERKAYDLSLANRKLLRAHRELEVLLRINLGIAEQLHRQELFELVARAARRLLPADRMGVFLPQLEQGKITLFTIQTRGATKLMEGDTFPSEGSVAGWVFEHREPFVAGSAESLGRFPVTRMKLAEEGMQAVCALPLSRGDRCLGVLFFFSGQPGAYDDVRLEVLEMLAGAVAVALDNCLAYEELTALRDRLADENVYLREEIRQRHDFGEIVGESAALVKTLGLVETVAPASSTVLILGETGTGKELIARAIHDRSPRRDRPLVKVNCSAISAGLVESELFGHVKGAFTGAVDRRRGRFELADGGTLLLDEIGDLPLETQVKLLRVLQEREFEPVGSSTTQRVDVRVIAATHQDLEQAVSEGRFRSDLYYRLNVLPLRLPPLRERRSDIPLLVQFFVERFATELSKKIEGVAPATMDRLRAYEWPGNVRELQNIVERAVVLSRGPLLSLDRDLLPGARPASRPSESAAAAPPMPGVEPDIPTLAEAERRHIRAALERSAGVVAGPRGAAQMLGIHPNTLTSRMKKLGIERKQTRP